MKKSTIKILFIQLFIFLVLIINYFFLEFFKYQNIYLIFALIIGLVAHLLLLGYANNKYFNIKEVTLALLIFTLLYEAIIFIILGWKLGFVKSPYHLGFNHLFKIVLPIILIIITSEVLRQQMISKGKMSKLILITTTLLFILLDLYTNINQYSLDNYKGLFELTAFIFLPSIIKNTFLTFAVYHFGLFPTLIYRLITELSAYYLPIMPNLGIYLQAILDIVLPFVLLLFIYNYATKIKKEKENKKINSEKDKFMKKIILLLSVVVLTIFIILVSGLFRFYLLVIGSGSMTPAINIGDMVLVEKLDTYSDLKMGDVLVYLKQNKVIVHRIVDIKMEDNTYTFSTKGDYNENVDGWTTSQKDVIGIARFKISYIGYPTVWLNRLFSGGR